MIIDRLHWIKGRISNLYLWIDEGELLLVDTGSPFDAGLIRRYLSHIGQKPSDITAILITHADYDHAGLAARLHEESGAPIYTGYKTADLLTTGRSPEHLPGAVQFLSSTIFRYQPVPTSAIRVVYDGETITDRHPWTLIETQGHSPDHQSFWSPSDSVLFAGDAFTTRGDRLKCSSGFNTGDELKARESARKLLLLHPAVFACGHGTPLQDHTADEVMALYRELERA